MNQYDNKLIQDLINLIFDVKDPKLWGYEIYQAQNSQEIRDKVIDGVFDKIIDRDSKLSKWGKILTRCWIVYRYGI